MCFCVCVLVEDIRSVRVIVVEKRRIDTSIKTRTWLLAFILATKPLGKLCIRLFSLQLWINMLWLILRINSRVPWVLYLCLGNWTRSTKTEFKPIQQRFEN